MMESQVFQIDFDNQPKCIGCFVVIIDRLDGNRIEHLDCPLHLVIDKVIVRFSLVTRQSLQWFSRKVRFQYIEWFVNVISQMFQ